ncbi:6bbf1566-90e4-4599-b931-e4c0db90ab2a [Sclerotinia trifoliorum]|uniref:6bbf1566-90e4-4599-b931-e4c0db90ab2a n=1 Tax=Sclerotinia trifoliorum TaxID=28548 RepID=A0A8H2ZQF5_9HELO|nr:6bbf1566-90e4-4599-b931-e4c0db90ab2a [Sclerotinia trifoliorum]
MNSSASIQAPSVRAYTPLEMKHMILKSVFKDGIGASKGFPSMALTHLSMYDAETTMPFAAAMSLGEGEGLPAVIENTERENAVCEERGQKILHHIQSPNNEVMRRSIEELLDQDINERGLLEKDPNIFEKSILSKAVLIVEDMERKRFENEIQYDGHDFRILLITLIDGWGQCSKVDLLYFNYKTSFPWFMSTLKDETRNNKIPPENITLPPLYWDNEVISTSSIQNINASEQSADRTGSLLSKAESAQTIPDTIRDPNDKGYNLSDGPWMYRLPNLSKDPAVKPGWKCIRTENDYMVMLDDIRGINFKYAEWGETSKCSVVIMHSLDKDCQQRYFDTRDEERAFGTKWEKELEEAGFFDDEEIVGNYGDDWFDHWNGIHKSPHGGTSSE